MPPLQKTMNDFREAHRDGRIIAVWGTGATVFALVTNDSMKIQTTEMWQVTP